MSTTEEKILVIAEKPSVAADFVKVLPGKFKKEKSHYEGENFVVSYAIGHLLTISDPGEINEKYKSWSLDYLPIIPEEYSLKPLSGSKSQLTALAKLIRRKDIKTIINACDAGREGELIFRYIMQYVEAKRKVKKTIKRLWLQSMTTKSIKDSFANLKSDEEMTNLTQAAMSRSEADWLIGINGSRGLTAYNSKGGGFRLTPCGRVQTPTLSLIIRREEERMAFVAESYWNLEATFSDNKNDYNGKWFDPTFKKDETKPKTSADKLWTEKSAQDIINKCKGKTGSISEQTKPSTQKCPPLYDLTSLQREGNSRFGYSAKRTLQLVQSLYERYKLTTYPRTSSRALPEDYLDVVKETIKSMTKGTLGKYAQMAIDNDYIKFSKKVFNNEKISDHHAIIPTGTIPHDLPEAESKIYKMISQRFLAVFFPTAHFLNTTRITLVEGESFKTDGKVMTEQGWKIVYGKSSKDDKILEAIDLSASPITKNIELNAEETKPPARYTESTLLSIMEGAGKLVENDDRRDAMKDSGLGTPATRAAIIEKLITDKYLVRDGKDLHPTSKAFDLIRIIDAMEIQDFTSPELTGEWEHKLNLMEAGKYTREKFMGEIMALTKKVVSRIKNFDEDKTSKEVSFSPVNGQKVFETVSRYETEDGKISIRKMLGGRMMNELEIKTLLEKRKIGPLTGFRSKRGMLFTAVITLNDKDKIEFVFDDDTSSANGEDFDINKEIPIGKSPVDDSPVYETLTGFLSKSALNKEKNGLRVSKFILGAEITKDNMIKLLSGEKTELIKDFRSARTKRNFDAYLKLSNNGKIEFEFPPRKFGKKKSVKKDEE